MKHIRKIPPTLVGLSPTSGDVPESPKQRTEHRLDEEALSRMNDEGGPNKPTATLPDSTGYSEPDEITANE